MKEDESECVHKNINRQKDANNEDEYEEPSVTYEVPLYFNIFRCGKHTLNRLGVRYEQTYIATPRDKYYEKMLEILVDYNDHHNAIFSIEKL